MPAPMWVGLTPLRNLKLRFPHFSSTRASLVFGSETADEAHRRFSLALYEVIETLPGSNLVVVTHGTVLTLFTTRLTGADPYLFWRGLGMPAYVVVSVPAMKVLEVCTKIGD